MDQASFLTGIEILDSSLATSSTASLYTYGGISIFNTSIASSTSGSLLTLGGINISKNTIIGGDTIINSTTISTNTSAGALIIAGGVGIQGSVYGNFSNFTNIQVLNSATLPNLITTSASIGTLSLSTFNPSNITTNNLVVTNASIGTLSILTFNPSNITTNNLVVTSSSITNCIFTNVTSTNLSLTNTLTAQVINITGTTEALSTTTGTIIVAGGIGVNQSIYANRGFYGDRANLANNARPINLIDTRAAISCWRWITPSGTNIGNPAVEFIAGTASSAIAAGNNYSDIYMDDSAAIAFRNRTTGGSLITFWAGQTGNIGIGTTAPNFKLDTIGDARISGNFTAGISLFTPNAIITTLTTGNALFTSTAISTNVTTGAVVINGGLGVSGSLNIGGNTVINGNLTINGTSISVNSTTVNINDNIIVLNSGPSGIADGGILVNRYQINNNSGSGDIVSDTPELSGTVQVGTNTTQIVLPNSASIVDGIYINYWIKITSGTANNNVRQITNYVGSTKTATLNTPLTGTPISNVDIINLYGNLFAANYFKESTNEFVLSYTNLIPGSIVSDTNYANLRISNLTSNLISTSNLLSLNSIVTSQTTNNSNIINLLSTNTTLSNLLITTSLNTPTISTVTTASIGTSLIVGTSAIIGSTLQVNGPTNIANNLNVIGQTTLGTLIANNTTIASLNTTNLVSTNTTLANLALTALLNIPALSTTTSASIGTSIMIGTSAVIGTTLQVNGPTNLTSNLNVIGQTTLGVLNANNSIISSLNTTNLSSTNTTITNLSLTSLSTITSASIGTSLIVGSTLQVNSTLNINSTAETINTSTGAIIVSGGAGFNGDIYAKNIYSNGVLTNNANSIWGSNYNYAFIAATTGTTSNSYQLRMALTTGNLVTGTYHIHTGYYLFSNSATNQNSEFRCLLDATSLSTGTLIHQSIFRPNNVSEMHTFYEISNIQLSSGVHTLSIIFRNQNNGSITNMSNSKLELYRIF